MTTDSLTAESARIAALERELAELKTPNSLGQAGIIAKLERERDDARSHVQSLNRQVEHMQAHIVEIDRELADARKAHELANIRGFDAGRSHEPREPIAWISRESLSRLKHGGNNRGSVPVHAGRSSYACIPLVLANQPSETSDRQLFVTSDRNKFRWALWHIAVGDYTVPAGTDPIKHLQAYAKEAIGDWWPGSKSSETKEGSSLCHPQEPCMITGDGKCDATNTTEPQS